MDEIDRDILKILQDDGKTPVEDIAEMVDLDVGEVKERIRDLEEDDVIRKYKAVIDWDKAKAGLVYASIDLKVELNREKGYDKICERIAGFNEVRTIRLISGESDIRVLVQEKSMEDVYSFVSKKISTLESVRDTVTHFVLRTYKEDGEIFFESETNHRLSISP
ncbi:MAG: DNA-binding transcriptional regulator Lrp family [Candidatus Methanohalarchaeum thermophilum]|uniref:DNA-binding transcriptional regulator Lrp family n=1 Tax=Methanohalarchaeum thermophilum TaxID=1903181 RepID=A0A1Q6DWY2_METT1|nr:MAG: DNA-binding transcriptional regulator Lrp family [Candidatus Methanohalarchaeum thermophilum]